MRLKDLNRGVFVGSAVALIFLVFLVDTGLKAYAQTQRNNEIKQEDNFNRPQPSKPIQPQIPGANRYQEDKVFLEYADSLYKVQTKYDTIERQILKGNVKFRQAGLWMFCDSAYYYPEENSLDAFSNVRMEQGDTLFVYADKLFYNGDEHLAKLKNGPTRDKVLLINKDVTLTTDSLDYDMQVDLGWYTRWGTIDDKVNTLTSLYGQYSPKTKLAEFFTDVVLVNNKDGYTMLTDTLYYSTETHIANIESRTEIQGANDTIITHQAIYYTDTGDADLLSRSTIIHRDSTGNVTTLEGDSIIYDNATRISRAYMFRDPFKRSQPMVITDTAQKTTLIGGFGIYNDSTKEALATIYPLLMEYSQGDTLFLRADTIKTYIITQMVAPKRRKTKSGYPEYNGLPIVIADSTGLWIDSLFFDVRIPYVDTPLMMLLKAAPPYKSQEIIVQNDNEHLPVEDSGILQLVEDMVSNGEHIPDTLQFEESIQFDDATLETDSVQINDIVGFVDSMKSYQADNPPDSVDIIERIELIDSLQPADSIAIKDIMVLNDTLQMLDSLPPNDSIPMEFHVALAYHRGRFFKQDMQGVADSIVFMESDSMLYLFRKPIIWSGERQVTGNRIDVHFNDSTTDWAYLPEFGLMSEHVEDEFYNQIFGKEITTYFENQGLRRMNVSGNVETIFLPQEEDSTFNRLVSAESSYMEVYLDSNKLDWLKMWPEVSGSVTPLFLVKRNQLYLQKFKWWDFLRPQREWYGDRWHWADNLGEVPDELEQYFLSPSDFGEPKSFSGTRFVAPPSSLPMWKMNLADSLIDADNHLDSLINAEPNINIPDSLNIGAESPGVMKVESLETLGDIENSEKEAEDSDKETELQSQEIEKAVKTEEDDFPVAPENDNGTFNGVGDDESYNEEIQVNPQLMDTQDKGGEGADNE